MTSIVTPDATGLTEARALVASRVKASLTDVDRAQLARVRDVYGPFDASLTAIVDGLLAP